MKSVLAALLAVVALVAVAEGLRRAASIEETLATADAQLTTTGTTTRDIDEAIDASLALTSRLPLLGTRLEQRVRRFRANQAYWLGEYDALINGPLAPTAGAPDATIQLLAANAAFRRVAAQKATPQVLAKSLDEVLKAYGAVIDADPTNVTGAYNYELVARLRNALAGGRTSGMPEGETPDMQGEEGEPPEGTRKSDFNVIVPLRPEERQEQMDPGSGADFKRKG